MMIHKEKFAILAACGALGSIAGYVIEQHTNDVSRGRVVTIDSCIKSVPHENTVTKDLLECMKDGVPGGNKVGQSLKEGQPIEFVESFRAGQQNEANTADLGNVALYGAGGVLAGMFFGVAD